MAISTDGTTFRRQRASRRLAIVAALVFSAFPLTTLGGASAAVSAAPFSTDPSEIPVGLTSAVEKLLPDVDNYGDGFGRSVDIDGDLAIVGTADSDPDKNEAFIFRRDSVDDGQWELVTPLTIDPTNLSAGNLVSISGTTAIAAGLTSLSVFEQDAGGPDAWSEVAVLTPAASPRYTKAVAQNGDTMMVGYGSSRRPVIVYQRDATGTWLETQQISAAAGGPGFGNSIGLDGDRALISDGGDRHAEAALIYGRNETSGQWEMLTTLTDPFDTGKPFGFPVALSGDTAMVGSNGRIAYFYERDLGGADRWGRSERLITPDLDNRTFGEGIALDGDAALISGSVTGVTHVYERDANDVNTWELVDTLTPNGVDNTNAISPLVLDGDTAMVGYQYGRPDNGDKTGFVMVLSPTDTGWAQTQLISAQNADTAREAAFGIKVDIDGDTAVVRSNGAAYDRNTAAYVFDRDDTNGWTRTRAISRPADAGQTFGVSVALSGDVLLVGDPRHEGDVSWAGAAYFFGRDVGGVDNWGLITKIVRPSGKEFAQFGTAVALDGDTAMVGASSNHRNRRDSGSTFVFGKDVGGVDTWGEVGQLIGTNGTARDYFGTVIALDDDIAAVSAPGTNTIHVFSRDAGAWGEVATLPGRTVDIHGNRMVVGKRPPFAATLYEQDLGGPDAWGLLADLTPPERDRFAGSNFNGDAVVAIGEGVVLVGATGVSDLSEVPLGAHLYLPTPGTDGEWGYIENFTTDPFNASDNFGSAIAIDGTTALVGASGDRELGAVNLRRAGAAYVLDLDPTSAPSTSLTIVEDVTPDNAIDFRFGGSRGAFSLDDPESDDADDTTDRITFGDAGGTTRIRQQAYGKYPLDAIECTPMRNPAAVDLTKRLLIVDLEQGERVTCTFTNSKVALSPGTVSARVGDDANGNGRFDAGEPWLSDWTIQLFDRDGYPIAEQPTDEYGRATFSVAPGDYTVCEVVEPGWTPTRPTAAAGEQPCTDVTVTSGRTSWLRFLNTSG